jgi:2-polyprenyl-3-methyl-5-hydroxy-6-metoxy-1,4-benzoquinol methylase
MAFLDRYLQKIRFSKVEKFIKPEFKLLDVGSENGDLFDYLNKNVKEYVGIDLKSEPVTNNNFTLVKGNFPDDLLSTHNNFDAVVMLAVVEHLNETALKSLSLTCSNILKPGGLLLMTIPSPLVDFILVILRMFRFVDAETLHEHHGFKPGDIKKIISNEYFILVQFKKFQLGLNNFYVFQKK